MRTITHIEGITELASAIFAYQGKAMIQTKTPPLVLASYLELDPKSHKFARVLTWLIAFYHESLSTIHESSISEKNKATANANIQKVFAPLLPPFPGQPVSDWYKQSMSDTDQSYFDLLAENIKREFPIYVPEQADLEKYERDLKEILIDLRVMDLPQWISADFEESIELTLIALNKVPYVAHRLIRECHGSILSKLFLAATPEHRKFMVRVATSINVILAAFVMPYEANQAGASYYSWIANSPVDTKQIAACAQPLALPAPKAGGSAKPNKQP